MKWYNYLACLFAGFFLANFVPHFIHGICGNFFPTPFAHPAGIGLSSPTVNVLWSLLNLKQSLQSIKIGKIRSCARHEKGILV